MDRRIFFFDDKRCYVVRWIANVTQSGARRHWEALIADPRFRPGDAALHDARGCALGSDVQAIPEEAKTYRVQVEPKVGFGRVAILVDDERMFAAAKQLLALLELEGSLVTRSEAEAKEWVGLAADAPLPYPV